MVFFHPHLAVMIDISDWIVTEIWKGVEGSLENYLRQFNVLKRDTIDMIGDINHQVYIKPFFLFLKRDPTVWGDGKVYWAWFLPHLGKCFAMNHDAIFIYSIIDFSSLLCLQEWINSYTNNAGS